MVKLILHISASSIILSSLTIEGNHKDTTTLFFSILKVVKTKVNQILAAFPLSLPQNVTHSHDITGPSFSHYVATKFCIYVPSFILFINICK